MSTICNSLSLSKSRLTLRLIINMTQTCSRRYVVNYVSILIIDICKVIVHQHVILLSYSPLPPSAFITPYSKATTRNDRSVIRSSCFGRQLAGIPAKEPRPTKIIQYFAGKALQSTVGSINLSARRLCRLPCGTKRHNDNATSKNGHPLHCDAIISTMPALTIFIFRFLLVC